MTVDRESDYRVNLSHIVEAEVLRNPILMYQLLRVTRT